MSKMDKSATKTIDSLMDRNARVVHNMRLKSSNFQQTEETFAIPEEDPMIKKLSFCFTTRDMFTFCKIGASDSQKQTLVGGRAFTYTMPELG